MNIAVWDTYVKTPEGDVLHFDILVPDTVKDPETVYSYGQAYLKSKGITDFRLDTRYCRFCHIESPTQETLDAIKEKGYDIIEMETIPATLPPNPSRRQMILYLRGHYDDYRFADFRNMTEEQVRQIIEEVTATS